MNHRVDLTEELLKFLNNL